MKTVKYFYEAAEIWYQRTHKLREYYEDVRNPKIKRAKAAKLFCVMFLRMQKVASEYAKISQPKAPSNYKEGGISYHCPVSGFYQQGSEVIFKKAGDHI